MTGLSNSFSDGSTSFGGIILASEGISEQEVSEQGPSEQGSKSSSSAETLGDRL